MKIVINITLENNFGTSYESFLKIDQLKRRSILNCILYLPPREISWSIV